MTEISILYKNRDKNNQDVKLLKMHEDKNKCIKNKINFKNAKKR